MLYVLLFVIAHAAVASDVQDWRNVFDAAIAAENDDDLEEAFSLYTTAAELAPEQPEVFYNLARVLDSKGRYDESIHRGLQAYELAMDPSTTLYDKLWEQDQRYISAAPLKHTMAALALSHVATPFARQKKLYEAMDASSRAHELDPAKGYDLNLNQIFLTHEFKTICANSSTYWDIVHQHSKQVDSLRVLALGDSHLRIFAYGNHAMKRHHFDVCLVSGATALGITNPKSVTQSLQTFRRKLKQSVGHAADYDAVLIMVGEVRTAVACCRCMLPLHRFNVLPKLHFTALTLSHKRWMSTAGSGGEQRNMARPCGSRSSKQ
jgi:tetratricopeptide (TPR) repeat protein